MIPLLHAGCREWNLMEFWAILWDIQGDSYVLVTYFMEQELYTQNLGRFSHLSIMLLLGVDIIIIHAHLDGAIIIYY